MHVDPSQGRAPKSEAAKSVGERVRCQATESGPAYEGQSILERN